MINKTCPSKVHFNNPKNLIFDILAASVSITNKKRNSQLESKIQTTYSHHKRFIANFPKDS